MRKCGLRDLVCDTSSLQYLHQVGLLYVVHALSRRVVVPPAVQQELNVGRNFGLDLPDIQRIPWIEVVHPLGEKTVRLLSDMGPGETAVLMLALENEDFVAVLDDSLARRRASLLDIPFTGTLGILLDAKTKGLLPAIRPVLGSLTALGFRLAPHTREMILKKAGE